MIDFTDEGRRKEKEGAVAIKEGVDGVALTTMLSNENMADTQIEEPKTENGITTRKVERETTANV